MSTSARAARSAHPAAESAPLPPTHEVNPNRSETGSPFAGGVRNDGQGRAMAGSPSRRTA